MRKSISIPLIIIVLAIFQGCQTMRADPHNDIQPDQMVFLFWGLCAGIAVSAALHLLFRNFRGNITGVQDDVKVLAAIRRIMQYKGDWVCETDASGNIIYYNSAYEAALGLTCQQAAGHSLSDFMHPEDYQFISGIMKDEGLSRPVVRFYNRIRMAGDNYIWLETVMNQYQTGSGEKRYSLFSRDLDGTLSEPAAGKDRLELLGRVFDTAVLLTSADTPDSVYDILKTGLRELIPAGMFIIAGLDPSKDSVRVVRTSGFEPFSEKIRKMAGLDPLDLKMDVSRISAQEKTYYTSRVLTEYPHGISGLSQGQIPEGASRVLQALLGINRIYVMGFGAENKTYGTMVLFSRAPLLAGIRTALETMVNMAGISLVKVSEFINSRDRDQFYQSLLGGLPDIVLRISPDLRITYANPSIERFMKKSPDFFIDKTFKECGLVSDSADQLERTVISVFKDSATTRSRMVIPTPRGIMNLEAVFVPEIDYSREVTGVIGLFHDISEMAQLQESLRESAEQFRDIVENSLDAIFIHKGLNILYANPAACRIAGMELAELRSMIIKEIIHPDDCERVLGYIRGRFQGLDVPEVYQARIRHKDGTYRTGEIHPRRILMNGEYVILGTVRDITGVDQTLQAGGAAAGSDSLQMVTRLEKMVGELGAELDMKEKMLISQSRLAVIGEMMENVAHQWRQPLNALSMLMQNLDLAAGKGRLNKEYITRNTVKGLETIDYMNRTIEDFRSFLKKDQKNVPFTLAELIRKTCSLVDATYRHSGIRLEMLIDSDAQVFGSPNLFQQALLNLLQNARDASLRVEEALVSVTLAVYDGHAVVKVIDQGGGVPSENVQRIFQAYFTTKAGGTGIGLYMARMITEGNLKGAIGLENTGSGSIFFMKLPLYKAEPLPPAE